ncbi:FecR family protein [Pedobacter sp. PWIIR3]
MPEQEEEFRLLLKKYEDGRCSAEEIALLESWYLDLHREKRLSLSREELDEATPRMWESIAQRIGERKTVKLWPRIAVAAAAVAAIVFGVWMYNYSNSEVLKPIQDDVAVNDVAPGRSGATIMLANGKVIELSGAKKGVSIGSKKLKYIDGSEVDTIIRNPDNQEVFPYNDDSEFDQHRSKNAPVLTASTAKGQTYEFTLPDGTHVWLNADSKITFPSQFIGRERKVLLSGEAYFAVKHNAKQPFRVESTGADGKSQIVEDIGTEFNINAYLDERSIKTTLVEGSAKISSLSSRAKAKDLILTPNQQAILTNTNLATRQVDVSEVVSWKEGLFAYNNTTLEEVMRQTARWYDITIVYEEDALKQKKLSGTVTRYDNLSSLLKAISYTANVNFKIEGRKLLIKR